MNCIQTQHNLWSIFFQVLMSTKQYDYLVMSLLFALLWRHLCFLLLPLQRTRKNFWWSRIIWYLLASQKCTVYDILTKKILEKTLDKTLVLTYNSHHTTSKRRDYTVWSLRGSLNKIWWTKLLKNTVRFKSNSKAVKQHNGDESTSINTNCKII